jgi:hypothetical protein
MKTDERARDDGEQAGRHAEEHSSKKVNKLSTFNVVEWQSSLAGRIFYNNISRLDGHGLVMIEVGIGQLLHRGELLRLR